MKKSLFIVILSLMVLSTKAQVTIGSGIEPDKNALLDLKEKEDGTSEKGFLLPRVALEATNLPAPLENHVKGMTVYNIAPSPAGVDAENYVSPGIYYNDGTKWERLYLGATNWFYMPSVSIKTDVIIEDETIDLYKMYTDQFTSPVISSDGAPANIPYIPAANQLYYYVTAADPNVFTIKNISSVGVMTYDVKAGATECSYLNIIFVLK